MEFHIRLTQPTLDLPAFERQLLDLDPAALVDLDSSANQLRISTLAQPGDLAFRLARTGHPVALEQIELQPSVCCGGCSG